MDTITGNFQYCYNGIPVIRGYCSSKTILKHSRPHPAYQRHVDEIHVEEIKEYLDGPGYIFMPEIVLSYDYSGMFKNEGEEWIRLQYHTPFEYLASSSEGGMLKVWDSNKGIEFRRIKRDEVNTTIRIIIDNESPAFDPKSLFNRIDGNHRLEALEMMEDIQVPFCIVLLASSGDERIKDREKIEMSIFHNINSKVRPLTPLEQYRGLFSLFTVAELQEYGPEFSLTKAFLETYGKFPKDNMEFFFEEPEDTILQFVRMELRKGNTINERDIYRVLGVLNHTYFEENGILRSCHSRAAIIPYLHYCFVEEKKKNAKLDAYNKWFINNRLYNVKDLDPNGMIEVFDSIYEKRKKQIFVAMPFSRELDFVFDAICETVLKINQQHGIDLPVPVRIDKQITGSSYDIISEMLDQIQNAGLLIADLTNQNANVYYEAGFAQGLIRANTGNATEVLYLISNPDDPEHPFDAAKFDIKHYKMIPYDNTGNGRDKLKKALEPELCAFYGI